MKYKLEIDKRTKVTYLTIEGHRGPPKKDVEISIEDKTKMMGDYNGDRYRIMPESEIEEKGYIYAGVIYFPKNAPDKFTITTKSGWVTRTSKIWSRKGADKALKELMKKYIQETKNNNQ